MKNSQLSNMLLKVGCFFLAQKFVLSIIICIFTATESAKPLNDAQMSGSFFYCHDNKRVMGTGTLVHSLGSMNLSPMILWTPFKPSKKVVSTIGKEWRQILCNSFALRLTRVLPGVRTYKSCIGGYSGWAVSVMATAEDLVVEGWSNTASQRNRPHM